MPDQHLLPIEYEDHWELPMQGLKVTRIVLDYSFGFDVDVEAYAVRIWNAFVYESQGEKHQLNAEENLPGVGPALAIFFQIISKVRAYKHGELEVLFTNGSRIFVPHDEQYEAWTIAGRQHLHFVSIPGGDLAAWLPDEPA